MDGKNIFRANFLIVYQDLVNSIQHYIDCDYNHGQTDKIDAYLAATIHAIIDYSERFWGDDTEIIKACKYANNTQKHNLLLISHKRTTGGVHFPIHFPLEFPPITVIWNYNPQVQTKSCAQKRAFEHLFAGKEIIETLQPIVQRIEADK